MRSNPDARGGRAFLLCEGPGFAETRHQAFALGLHECYPLLLIITFGFQHYFSSR